MTAENVKISALLVGNISLNSVSMLIQKALPFLSFLLIVLQIIAALYAVVHIWRKRKNEKIPQPPDI